MSPYVLEVPTSADAAMKLRGLHILMKGKVKETSLACGDAVIAGFEAFSGFPQGSPPSSFLIRVEGEPALEYQTIHYIEWAADQKQWEAIIPGDVTIRRIPIEIIVYPRPPM